MKELSIEQKAQRYDEAIERAKKVLLDCTSEEQKVVEYITPELKESEDERIRQFLIHEVTETSDEIMSYRNMNKEDVLAWLEKQGEHTNFRNKIQIGDKVTRNEDGVLVNLSQLNRVAKKQGEQKPADKVEPKFREGEWITNGDYTWKIVEVKPLDYILQSQDGNIVDDTISHVDGQFHSFTIEDAKDGDVLYIGIDGSTCIFKKLEGNLLYSYITSDGKLLAEDSHYYYETSDNVHPATKEQRDTLFAKMKEAGYEWDAEHKQLKKIEQNPAWSEEDEVGLGDAMLAIKQAMTIAKDENDMGNLWYAERWLESLKDRVQPEQEWSEEDAKALNRISTILVDASEVKNWWKEYRLIERDEMIRLTDFLKSIKPLRSTQ